MRLNQHVAGALLGAGLLWGATPGEAPAQGALNRQPKITWHWHVHQPIYWNGQNRLGGDDRYEYAWDSIRMKDGGNPHPTNSLRDIFGLDDRVAAYQFRMRDALGTIGDHPKSGVVVSYSGALIQNVRSLGLANQLGYSPNWKTPLIEANNWNTTNGYSRLEFTNFSFHHGLSGLLPDETNYMSIRIQQEIMRREFGNRAVARGYFPTEMTWTKRLIPTLRRLGVDWTIVSGEHIARACPDFPVQLGSGGVGCDPPNRADQINPNGEQFIRITIQRGCSPVNANPLSFQPAWQTWVDPMTGQEERIIVVPADQAWGWLEGYGQINAQMIDDLKARNNPNQPSLVLMSHDGDNAYAGGFSYYMENLRNLANDARGRGGEVTSISQYLHDFPPPASSVVHVEDGGWVNADGDFGSPVYINWNYPLLDQSGAHDPKNGWHEKVREMAIFHEVLNRLLTAEALTPSYTRNYAKIVEPDSSTHPIDRAWHYYLGSFDSGNVYYGNVEDFSIKGTLGALKVDQLIGSIISNPGNETVPPTVMVPQRHPYNPGSLNFGVAYASNRYQGRTYINNGDFTIWTFVSDVSGPPTAVLKYRIDNDGVNPLNTSENETYAGGPGVGDWISLPMVGRQFPIGNVFNKPDVRYSLLTGETLLPNSMPWHFHAEINDLRSTLIDYYVEATDANGNVSRSAIQHVYIGDGSGATGGTGGNGNDVVTIEPSPAIRGQNVTVTYNAQGRNLASASQVFMHYGKNNYAGGAVVPDATMTNAGNGFWTFTYTVPEDANNINMVFNNGSGTWDNNGGANWNFPAVQATEPQPPVANFTATPRTGVAPLSVAFTDTTTNGPISWAWDFNGDGTTDSTLQNPSFVYTEPGTYTVTLTATNAVDSDSETKAGFIVVTAPPTDPIIALNKTSLTAAAIPGTNPAADTFTVRNEGAGTLNYTIATTYDGVPPAPTVEQVLAALRDGGSATGLDANGDGIVDVADLVRAQLGIPGPSWLNVSPTSGSVTTNTNTVNVTYNTTGLQEGTYNATITVAGNAPNSPRTIPVTLNIGPIALPTIGVSTSAVNQTASVGSPASPSTFTVSNSGGGTLNWTATTVDVGNGKSWFSIAPGSGSSTGAPQTVTVSYSTTDLAVGTYRGRIDIAASGATNSPQTVDVTLTVVASIPNTTTVTPNPPTAGQAARVWYSSNAGPIGGRVAYQMHWGINGGTVVGQSAWQNVTTTPLVNAEQGGMWYADIIVPQNATTLNFVFNDGNNNWDNNNGQDWNFVVTPANVGSATISLSPSELSFSAPEGGSVASQTVTLGNTGDASLTWNSSVQYASAKRTTEKATGSRKTITIDGRNTSNEWTTEELVATAPAWNHANVVGGNWSTHETQFDYTALYAAWDADNLYVGIQIVDVVDVEDPANAGSSQGTAPVNMNLPQFIAINTRPGGYGNPSVPSDMWGKAHGFAGEDQVNYQVYFASNFWQGPFVCEYIGGWNPDRDAYGPPGGIYRPGPGLRGASAKADAGAPIIGPTGKNYRTLGHDTGRNSFFELAIPLNLIGNPDLENGSIGIFVGHGEGFSGVDTIPVDPAATNTPGTSQSNSPNEWEDIDVYTVPFARVGKGDGPGGVGSNWLTVTPSQGSLAASANTDLQFAVNTDGLEPGVYTASVSINGNASNSPQTVDVTVTITGTGTDPVIQISRSSLSATTAVGANPAAQTFTIRNSGAGVLEYAISKNDTGNGTSWFSVSPSAGTATGALSTISVNFDSTGLEVGTYNASLAISGNATNSPQTVTVQLVVQANLPNTTTVVPNPPVAGAAARVWYASTAGPIAGRSSYNLYWGINGGAAAGGSWTNITSTPMVNAQQGGMWYADITVPAAATSLNFVVNHNGENWDNNGGADWNFLTAVSNDPLINLSVGSISSTALVGGSANNSTFTISNGGAGSIDYTIAKTDTGSGTAWFNVTPTAGTVSGTPATITVSYVTTGLAAGTYSAALTITGNATNSPRTVTVQLTVQGAVPTTTTVVPNPPIAGAAARVWYASTAGPIAGRTSYNLHWGINGGAAAGGSWINVTSTPMVDSQSNGMWFADITIPAGATSLNFVVNHNGENWDSNGGADWNFLTATSSEPVITVSANTVSADAAVGGNAANTTFTVRNGGAATLNYTITKVDTGNGVNFFNVSPASGSSTGEADTVTVSWNTAGLAAGTYLGGIQIAGNATNSPVVVTARLTVGAPQPTVRPITIGRGPLLGTNTEGTQYFEEFQDWNAGDLRALDTNDAIQLSDGYDMSRDIVALYSRFENDNLFLRVDLLELGIFAENGFVDVYVLIDCASGGTTSLPNGLPGSTQNQWNLAVATYDATNNGIIRADGTQITGAHLGSYWRSDLDAVEFGVRQSALREAGWDGTSPVRLMAFTAKDLTQSVTDTVGFSGGILSNNTPGRAKFATIAHGNQSLNRGDSMRDRIYISGANTGVGAPSGFRLTLDTHRIFQVPLNIHMSATLITAINWIEDANPIWDGGAFINYVGSFIDDDQTIDPGMKIGGVFSEHIMPFFVGEVNLNSIKHFDDLTRVLWGIDGNDMKVMHVPERVANSRANQRDLWDDIVDSPYIATVIDEVAHIRNWLYPSDPWTGIGGEYGNPRQHKIIHFNGVYNFQINDNEDHYKFWPQDGGANMNWRLNLLWKALDTDQEQLTLIFDDWEALAGYSFGSGYNDNALQYNDVMRWVANKPWIEVVTLKEILDRATNSSNPLYSDNWVVRHGNIGDKPFDTYDYLHHATQNTYENWYYGSPLEESFRNAVPVLDGVVGSGRPMPSGKIFGELGTPGTIIHDTWEAIKASPNNSMRRLAELAYQCMIYETAWHDEDNTNYERLPPDYKQWRFPDTTFDRVAGWAYTLHNHLRGATITTTAAHWVEAVKNGSRPAGVTVTAIDLDQDGEVEYVLANERIWIAFEARGGRAVQAYYYDPSIQDGISFLGTSPMNNPSGQGEEEGTTLASRCSGFKEMNQGIYADAIYSVSLGSNSITFTSPNGQVIKTISLTAGSNIVTANYTNNTGGDLFVRMGVGVNNLDLMERGQNFTSTYSASSFTQTNNTRGSLTITGNGGVTMNQLDTFTRFVIPLTEQMEVRIPTGSQSFTLSVPN